MEPVMKPVMKPGKKPLMDKDELFAYYKRYGQSQVFAWIHKLGDADRDQLLAQMREFDLEEMENIFKSSTAAEEKGLGELAPPRHFQRISDASEEEIRGWEEKGLEAIRNGQIAVLVLGGGAGTRLGFSGPKGNCDIGLLSCKTLFQLFVERVNCLRKLAGENARIPFIVMTNPNIHEQTISHFKKYQYFGLPEEDFYFFQQGILPVFSIDGNLMLKTRGEISTSPDGNGGIYLALKKSGVLATLRERKVHAINVFSVDNALTKPADPRFIGYMLSKNADCGNKSVSKQNPEEKIGVVAMRGDKYCVAEYTELDKSRREQRDEKGNLVFGAGNICNHYFTIDFLENTVLPNWTNKYHIARKEIQTVNHLGEVVRPVSNNCKKLEFFIFDVFPMAERFALLECAREEEFSPVKNAFGSEVDSPGTAVEHIHRLHKKWVEENGGTLKGDELVEVDTKLSYQGENLSDICKGKVFKTPLYLTSGGS